MPWQAFSIHTVHAHQYLPDHFLRKGTDTPNSSALGEDDRAVRVVVKPLLEDAATEIVSLAIDRLLDCAAKFCIADSPFCCTLCEIRRIEASCC